MSKKRYRRKAQDLWVVGAILAPSASGSCYIGKARTEELARLQLASLLRGLLQDRRENEEMMGHRFVRMHAKGETGRLYYTAKKKLFPLLFMYKSDHTYAGPFDAVQDMMGGPAMINRIGEKFPAAWLRGMAAIDKRHEKKRKGKHVGSSR